MGRCLFVYDIIPEEAFATAKPPPERKSYGTPYVRLPRRLFTLTDEAQDILNSWRIATTGNHQSKKEQQVDGVRATNDDAYDEDIHELDRDA